MIRARTLPVPPARVWSVICDVHHLSRWWPGVRRIEGVEGDRFTEVLQTRRGRSVRVDLRIAASEPPNRLLWEQELAGTPFERVLASSAIELRVEPDGEGSTVTISQRQRLRGYSRLGGWMLRRATRRRLDEALDGLAAIV